VESITPEVSAKTAFVLLGGRIRIALLLYLAGSHPQAKPKLRKGHFWDRLYLIYTILFANVCVKGFLQKMVKTLALIGRYWLSKRTQT
jgi:cytochrome c oxidase subunit IV